MEHYFERGKRMKVFISQPMRDRTDVDIMSERSAAIAEIKEQYPEEDVDIIDSFFKDVPHDVTPLWYLAKSLELLSMADLAFFCNGWSEYRGCKIEYRCAIDYGIPVIAKGKVPEYI